MSSIWDISDLTPYPARVKLLERSRPAQEPQRPYVPVYGGAGKLLWLPKFDPMRVPSKVLNAVVFLGYRTEIDGQKVDKWGGTGFLVADDVKGCLSPYIVTADHVAKQLETLAEPIARINDANGRGHHYRLMKPTETKIKDKVYNWTPWYRHPTDKKADVAVYSFTPAWIDDWKKAPFAHFPFNMCVSPSMLYGPEATIGIGDEVFVPGLVAHVAGDEANSPLLRVGNIAMLPDEQIYVGPEYGFIDAYLAEVRSLGNLSGAPVFVRGTHKIPKAKVLVSTGGGFGTLEGPETVVFTADYLLLGLMHGHWNIDAEDINAPQPRLSRHGDTNLGLAIVTPAQKIVETINHPELVRQRKEFVERVTADRGEATMDSTLGDGTRGGFEEFVSGILRVPKSAVEDAEAKRLKRPSRKRKPTL